MVPPQGKPPVQIYCAGDRTIDLSRREIRAGNSVLPLRKKAFDVLAYLLANRDRTVTKQELLGSVWEATAVSEDVLVGCVAEIRKVLGDNPAEPALVRTVHGVGYLFVGAVKEAGPNEDRAPVLPARRRNRTSKILTPIGAALLLLLIGLAARRRLQPVYGEVAWWKFDEETSAVMDSASANRGKVYGGIRRVEGRLGAALEFDGATARVIGDDPGKALPRGGTPRTITAWIRSPSPPGADTGIFHYGTDGQTPPRANFHLYLAADGRIGLGNGWEYGAITGDKIVSDNHWHHVVGRYDGPATGRLLIYVDGLLDKGGLLPQEPETGSGTPWSIGIFQSGGLSFRGLIDDVRVFARAVKSSEIQSLHRCGLAEPDVHLPLPGVAYYLSFQDSVVVPEERSGSDSSTPIRFVGGSFGGVQFAIATADCRLSSLRGAELPENLRVSADLSTGTGQSEASYAGLLIASRSAGPDEPVSGPSARGVWVRLSSTGEVSVVSLKEGGHPLAVSRPVSGFDSNAFHTLTVERKGQSLHVRLNQAGVVFRVGSQQRESDAVVIPPEALGGGAAGLGFEQRMWLSGRPPRARNVIVTAL